MQSDAFTLMINNQVLTNQNELAQKTLNKKQHENKQVELSTQESTVEDSKVKHARKKQQDVLSRRRNIAQSMIKKSHKNSSAKATKLSKPKPNLESKTDAKKLSKVSTEMEKASKELKDKAPLQFKALNNFVNQKVLKGVNLKGLEPEVSLEEFGIDLDKDLRVIDQLFDPKNIKTKMTPEQIKAAKAKAKQLARQLRPLLKKALKPAINMASMAFAKTGLDLKDGEPKKSNEKKKGEKSKSKSSVDSAIFEAMYESLNASSVLQELGVNVQIDELSCQNANGKWLISESNDRYEKNVKQIEKSEKMQCLHKALGILGDIIGGILILLGCEFIGVMMILSSTGVVDKMVEKLAEALHISKFAVKSIILALTLLVSIMSCNPAGMFGEAAGMSVSTAVMTNLFMMGTLGWVQDFLGVCATGHDDESKFPDWVMWTTLGLNLGVTLLTIGPSIIKAASSLMKMLAKGVDGAWNGMVGMFEGEQTLTSLESLEGLETSAESSIVPRGPVEESATTRTSTTSSETSATTASEEVSSVAPKEQESSMFLKGVEWVVKKMLKALQSLQASNVAALEDAMELGSSAKKIKDIADRASHIMSTIKRLLQASKSLSRWLLVAAQGMETVAQFEIASNQFQIAKIIEDAAKLTGEMELLEQFNTLFGMTSKTTQKQNQEIAKDMADEFRLIGTIISNERKSISIMATA